VDTFAAPAARLHWKARVAMLAAALWWGSLCVIGFLVVPLLFANLPTPAMAGSMAGRLFSAQTWLSVACALLLFLASQAQEEGGSSLDWRGGALLFVIAGLLLALLSQFGVAPHILARENLKVWHAVGSAMYLLQWLCATVVLWRVTSPSGVERAT
jgi:hypothetical protein